MEGFKIENKEGFDDVFKRAHQLLESIDSTLTGFERDKAVSSLMNELISTLDDESDATKRRQLKELVEAVAQVAKYQEKVTDINDYIKSHPGVVSDETYKVVA